MESSAPTDAIPGSWFIQSAPVSEWAIGSQTPQPLARMPPTLAPAPGRQSSCGPTGSVHSTTNSASGQPLPVAAARGRKRKAPTLRDSDWEQGTMKNRISQMYINENYTIPRLRDALSREFGLHAT
jgi:hypothetical protein